MPDGNRYYCNSTARMPRRIHMPDGNRYYCNSTARCPGEFTCPTEIATIATQLLVW